VNAREQQIPSRAKKKKRFGTLQKQTKLPLPAKKVLRGGGIRRRGEQGEVGIEKRKFDLEGKKKDENQDNDENHILTSSTGKEKGNKPRKRERAIQRQKRVCREGMSAGLCQPKGGRNNCERKKRNDHKREREKKGWARFWKRMNSETPTVPPKKGNAIVNKKRSGRKAEGGDLGKRGGKRAACWRKKKNGKSAFLCPALCKEKVPTPEKRKER